MQAVPRKTARRCREEAAYAAAQQTYDELRASNPDFKRIYDDMVAFQKDQNLWAGVAEGRQDAFMQSISR